MEITIKISKEDLVEAVKIAMAQPEAKSVKAAPEAKAEPKKEPANKVAAAKKSVPKKAPEPEPEVEEESFDETESPDEEGEENQDPDSSDSEEGEGEGEADTEAEQSEYVIGADLQKLKKALNAHKAANGGKPKKTLEILRKYAPLGSEKVDPKVLPKLLAALKV